MTDTPATDAGKLSEVELDRLEARFNRGHMVGHELRSAMPRLIASARAQSTAQHPPVSGAEGALSTEPGLPMDLAPRDGTIVRLLVDYEGAEPWCPLEDANHAWTIGGNNFDNDGEDVWRFAGWSRQSDVWCEGAGKVLRWAPFDNDKVSTPTPSDHPHVGSGEALADALHRWLDARGDTTGLLTCSEAAEAALAALSPSPQQDAGASGAPPYSPERPWCPFCDGACECDAEASGASGAPTIPDAEPGTASGDAEAALHREAQELLTRLEWGGVGETAQQPSKSTLEACSMLRRFVRAYPAGCLSKHIVGTASGGVDELREALRKIRDGDVVEVPGHGCGSEHAARWSAEECVRIASAALASAAPARESDRG